MGRGIGARTFLAAGLLAIIIGATFAVLLISINSLQREVDLERQSEEVLIAANRLERFIVDLETGLRGFVITGHERFLEPWSAARSALGEQTRRLERLVVGIQEQEARARSISEAAISYLHEYSIPLLRWPR